MVGLYADVDVSTSETPVANPSAQGQGVKGDSPAPLGAGASGIPKTLLIGIVAVAVIVIASAAYFVTRPAGAATTTTTTTTVRTATTTIPQHLSSYQVDSCAIIGKPGVYNITQDIFTYNAKGPCISIISGDVVLNGGGHSVTGSGPFVKSAPPSYGIYAANVSDVTVEKVAVSRFSYGVYLAGDTDSGVYGITATNATLSDIYLNNTYDSVLSRDTRYEADSSGGLSIIGGGNNTVGNSSMMYNVFYGLYLNSSNNRFYNDSFANNPIDLVCGSNANNRNSNRFQGSNCEINNYCNFAHCKSQNDPYNIGNTQLQHTVSTCGTIDNAGVYTLSGNISLTDYVNVSNPLSSRYACITINSPDTRLDCNNNTIANSYYGVVVAGLYNTSVVDCAFRNDTYGLYERNTIGTVINNIKSTSSIYGVYLNATTGGLAYNVTGKDDVYGLFINASQQAGIYGINAIGNTYGVYVNGQEGNNYYSGTAINNSKGDFYCSASAYNSTQNIFHPFTCGSSDCAWASASCRTAVPVPLAVTPVYSCGAISASGNYKLNTGLVANASQACIKIEANDVSLDCGNHIISGIGSGTGIFIGGRNNVTLDNCRINGFDYAFRVANSSFITIQGSNASSNDYGFYMSNTAYSTVENNNASVFSRGAFYMDSLDNTVVKGNSAVSAGFGITGFSFKNASEDMIVNNKARNNGGYGFTLSRSKNNTMSNNTETGNGNAGYYCDAYSSGLYAQHNGVDYGIGKNGCKWMVEINPSVQESCSAVTSPSVVSFSQDMLYTYGSTCYSVMNQNGRSANNTVINCNGHTVLATDGGTFANISRSSGVQIENCYLKGFTNGIMSNGSDTTVLNNTIANTGTGVSISSSKYSTVKNNIIMNSSYGIIMGNTEYGNLENNTFASVNISMEFNNLFGALLQGNNARFGNIGMYLLNSTQNYFQDNTLMNQSNSGIICDRVSGNVINLNKDEGGNACSRNLECSWMTASPLCRT